MTNPSPVQGTVGQFNLKIVRTNSNGNVVYNVNRTVDFGCPESDFANVLNSFDIYSSSKISVTR